MVGHKQSEAHRCNIENNYCLDLIDTSRRRGLPRKSWIEIFTNDLKSYNLTNKLALRFDRVKI